MREAHFVGEFDPVPPADPKAGRRPFADSIQSQDGGFLEGGREKRAGGVGLVVLGIDITAPIASIQTLAHPAGKAKLVVDPLGHGQEKGAKAPGGDGEVSLQEALELKEGLFVEDDVVDVFRAESRLGEAIVDGLPGKPLVVFDPAEALLLGGGHDPAVHNQGGRRIVVEGGQPENRRHGLCAQAVARRIWHSMGRACRPGEGVATSFPRTADKKRPGARAPGPLCPALQAPDQSFRRRAFRRPSASRPSSGGQTCTRRPERRPPPVFLKYWWYVSSRGWCPQEEREVLRDIDRGVERPVPRREQSTRRSGR